MEKKATAGNGYSANAKYCFQPSAWNDTEAMLKWVNLVLKPYVAQTNVAHGEDKLYHVLIDDYNSHKASQVVKAIRSLGCIVSILPGGSTSQIQPLDVGINKPFKDHLKKDWVDFMVNNRENNNEVSRELLSHWITESFKKVSEDSIPNIWKKKCGYIYNG